MFTQLLIKTWWLWLPPITALIIFGIMELKEEGKL